MGGGGGGILLATLRLETVGLLLDTCASPGRQFATVRMKRDSLIERGMQMQRGRGGD